MAIPKRVETRIKAGLKKFRPILDDARKADRSEEDTVTRIRCAARAYQSTWSGKQARPD